MKLLADVLKVHWNNDDIYEEDLEDVPRLKNRSSLFFYKKCILNRLTIRQGDYVCVQNGETDAYNNCWVAKVLYLYEDHGNSKKPKSKAFVEWYSRPKDLEKIVDDPGTLEKLDKSHELVHDFRESPEIDIDSIFDICVMLESKKACESAKTPEGRYFCNYKLSKIEGSRKFQIVPIRNTKSRERLSMTIKKVQTIESKISNNSPSWVVLNKICENDILTSSENLQQKTPRRSAQKRSPVISDDEDFSPIKSVKKTPRARRILDEVENDQEYTPGKNSRKTLLINENLTPSTPKNKSIPARRKSILKTPTAASSKPCTPRRSIQFSGLIEERRYDPSENRIKEVENEFAEARKRLHVSAVPSSLKCRDKEMQEIYSFLSTNLEDETGGCMYISGVPGTGKTATTSEVIRSLRREQKAGNLPNFDFVEINGMKFTEPRNAYQEIYRQLSGGKTVPWEQAYNLLDKRFSKVSQRLISTILIVDELDILCNKRQDVVYNLLNWPNLNGARLIVVTIANTMDLPERVLMGKVTSRLGLTRLTFQPYSFKQLQEIVASRLSGLDSFNSDAIQLVSRKVAALSGDARRALDICRRASEIAERDIKGKTSVDMTHVTQALSEMISSTKVRAIKGCSFYEKMFVQAVCMEVERTGIEEVNFRGVYNQLKALTALNDVPMLDTGVWFSITTKLNASRLLICEHARKDIHMKILLNISADDFYYATSTQLKNVEN